MQANNIVSSSVGFISTSEDVNIGSGKIFMDERKKWGVKVY
jgi:hypothetical protein